MSEEAARERRVPHEHGGRPYEWVGDWGRRRARLTPDRSAAERRFGPGD